MGIWWYQGDFTDDEVFNTPGIDVTDEAVVQYDVTVVKILFVSADNIQLIGNKFWCEHLCTVSGPSFMYSFI